jgi:hypothetical protein
LKTILKRERTSDEKHIDRIVKSGLMRLGENPNPSSSERNGFAVTEPHRPPNPYQHYLFWDRMGRKGQSCRIINPDQKNARSLQIQFEDGHTAVVNRRAIRRRIP